MATFIIPGDVITRVRAAGGSAPDTGYYAAIIESIEAGQKNSFSRRLKLSIDGFKTSYFMNSPYDDKANLYPGITEDKAMGMLAFTKAIFESAGFTDQDMAQGVSDDWLLTKTAYVEWGSAKDLGANYGEVIRFISKTQFDKFKAEGKVPAIANAARQADANSGANFAVTAPNAGVGLANAVAPVAQVVVAAPPVPSQAVPSPMIATPAVPNNGVGVGGVSVPPPPSSTAQQIVS